MSTQIAERKNSRLPAKALLAGILSMLVPGLGQIYARKGERGAAILIATIVVGNLNAIWLSLFATANHVEGNFWSYNLPLLLHDLFAAYAVIFLIWQIVDAYQQANIEYYWEQSHGN
jgi:TM2 domain-containing membrane protein YozV